MSWFKLGGKDKNNADPASAPKLEDADALAAPPTGSDDDAPGIEHGQEHGRKIPEALADLFLVMEEHLNPLELEEIEGLVANLKQPPPLVEKLTSGLDEPEELKEAIVSSPTLSADVLRVVNSAAFALSSPISSIEHAVTYLGTNMVKGLVMQSAVTQIMAFETDVQKAAYMRIWQASYVASATAQAYAKLLNFEHPSVFATRALLAGVGDLALVSARPELAIIYAPKTTLLMRVEEQQREIVANSAVLSSRLCKHWGLPDDLCTALRYSLAPLAQDPEVSERQDALLREDVLVYLACRAGDAVAYQGLKNIGELDLINSEDPSFFYLREYLRRSNLGELPRALADRQHGGRVQRIIDTFGS